MCDWRNDVYISLTSLQITPSDPLALSCTCPPQACPPRTRSAQLLQTLVISRPPPVPVTRRRRSPAEACTPRCPRTRKAAPRTPALTVSGSPRVLRSKKARWRASKLHRPSEWPPILPAWRRSIPSLMTANPKPLPSPPPRNRRSPLQVCRKLLGRS